MAKAKKETIIQKPSRLQVWEQALETFQGGFFAVLYGFFLKESWLQFMQYGFGKFIFGPISTILLGVKWLISLIDLIIAKNKNLGRVAQFGLNTVVFGLSAAFFAVSLTATFVSVPILTAIAPILLTGLLATIALGSVGLALFHGFKWLTSPNDSDKKGYDPEGKKLYRQMFVRSLVVATLLTALTVTVGLLTIFQIAPTAMAITSVAISVVGFGLAVLGALKCVKGYFSGKKTRDAAIEAGQQKISPDNSPQHSPRNSNENIIASLAENKKLHGSIEGIRVERENKKGNNVFESLVDEAPEAHNPPKVSAEHSWSDYYYRANRVSTLLHMAERNSSDIASDMTKYLIAEIDKKIPLLIKQRDLAATSFSARLEHPKRVAKIELLSALKAALENNKLNDYLKDPKCKQQVSKACQSFFRATGDVEDILEAVKTFDELQKPSPVVNQKSRRTCFG